jgi:hypothetical protein
MRFSLTRPLSSDEPHGPAGDDDSAEEHDEAVEAVANHVAGGFAMGDAEDDRREEREDKGGAEVGELDGHCMLIVASCGVTLGAGWIMLKAGSSPALRARSE